MVLVTSDILTIARTQRLPAGLGRKCHGMRARDGRNLTQWFHFYLIKSTAIWPEPRQACQNTCAAPCCHLKLLKSLDLRGSSSSFIPLRVEWCMAEAHRMSLLVWPVHAGSTDTDCHAIRTMHTKQPGPAMTGLGFVGV